MSTCSRYRVGLFGQVVGGFVCLVAMFALVVNILGLDPDDPYERARTRCVETTHGDAAYNACEFRARMRAAGYDTQGGESP